MHEQLIIRQETLNDFSEIFLLIQKSFGRDNEAILVNSLRTNPVAYIAALALVASLDKRIVGYILFTIINIMDKQQHLHESLALAPLAVDPDYQGKGIGGKLINYGLNRARELSFKSAIVLGHKDYYPRFGFEPSTKWGILSPFKLSDSGSFMAIELVKGSLMNISGMVIYSKEFNEV